MCVGAFRFDSVQIKKNGLFLYVFTSSTFFGALLLNFFFPTSNNDFCVLSVILIRTMYDRRIRKTERSPQHNRVITFDLALQ